MKEKKAERIVAQKSAAMQKNTSRVGSQSLLQLLLPHIVAVLVFVFVTLLYFSPMLLDNKILRQSDIIQYKGMSKELVDFHDQTGKSGLWTNSMFGGMPGFQIAAFYEGNLVQYIDKILSLGFPHPSELMLISFLCFYILLVVLRVNPWLAIGGGIAYGLCSFNLILLEAGHTSELHAIGLIPLVIAGLLLMRQGRYAWGAVFTAVGLSLEIFANHLQITYYLLLLVLMFGIVELIFAIRHKTISGLMVTVGIGMVCALFAVLSNLSLLWSTYEYLPSTIRGPSELSSNKQSTGGLDKDYALQWSYGKWETFTLLIPDFYGGSSNAKLGENSNLGKTLREKFNVPEAQIKNYLDAAPMYWGDVPFTSGPVYLGAIICFLFVFGVQVIRERWKWWLIAASLLSIFLAWGRNMMWFSDLFFYHFPGYNKFRTVSMALVIVEFTFPLMGFLLLSKILKGEFEKAYLISKLKVSVYITGGLCLFFAVAGSMFFDFRSVNDAQIQKEIIDSVIADRESLFRMDAFRSLVFILLAASLIWAFLTGKVKQNIFIGGMAVLVFVDLFGVGKRYIDSSDFVSKNEYNKYFEPTQVDQLILKETSKDYRVFNLATNTFSDSHTSYFHKSLGGYHAAKLRRYQEIIEHQLSKNDSASKSALPFNKAVVDMLNTKYFIVKAGDNEQVVPNTQALDNAWFVKDVKTVNNADEEMSALNGFNPSETVIVDKRFSPQLNGFMPVNDSASNIVLQSYAVNDLVYKSTSTAENIAVFSEIYYQPGWDAFIDGKASDHFRCNYILRGMRIPAGDHTIEFKFEPVSYYLGEKIAMAASGMIWLLLIGIVVKEFLRRRSGEDIPSKE